MRSVWPSEPVALRIAWFRIPDLRIFRLPPGAPFAGGRRYPYGFDRRIEADQ